MLSLLKKTLCRSLSLLLLGCATLPSEKAAEERSPLEVPSCGADRL